MSGIGCFLVSGFVGYHYPARTGSSTPWRGCTTSWIVDRDAVTSKDLGGSRRNGRRTPRFRCVVPLLRSNEKIAPFMATYLSDFFDILQMFFLPLRISFFLLPSSVLFLIEMMSVLCDCEWPSSEILGIWDIWFSVKEKLLLNRDRNV